MTRPVKWVHVKDKRIVAVFDDATEDAVKTAGEVLDVESVHVPEDIRIGATLINGTWTNLPVVASTVTTMSRRLSTTLFRQRFTIMEEAAIKRIASTDAFVSVFFDRILDPRLLEIDLADAQVVQGLGYLSTLDDPFSNTTPRAKLLSATRVAALLA